MKYLLLLALITLVSTPRDIVYGTLDYIEVEDLKYHKTAIDWYAKAKSVAVIVPSEYLIQVSENEFRLDKFTLQDEIETIALVHPFKEQICVGVGTAFLVAPNQVLTAGHLVKDLRKSVILFDYVWDSSNGKLGKERYRRDEVFHLKKIIARRNSRKGDFALIEMDKLINDRDFLELADFNERKGSAVKMISCPDGTPLKLTNYGVIWDKLPSDLGLLNEGYFIHNLDNSGGSSGAPIF